MWLTPDRTARALEHLPATKREHPLRPVDEGNADLPTSLAELGQANMTNCSGPGLGTHAGLSLQYKRISFTLIEGSIGYAAITALRSCYVSRRCFAIV
jgi:hypothetical protein